MIGHAFREGDLDHGAFTIVARLALAVAAGAALLAFAAPAEGATVTYRNDTTQFTPVGFFNTGQSLITVPAGRTPVEKVELPGVKMTAATPHGDDLHLDLVGPAGTSPTFDLISGPGTCNNYNQNTPTDFTDSGQPISLAACTGNRKPEDPRTLALFNGGPSSGTWTMLIDDADNAPNSNVSFFGWGLRITHAPLVIEAKGKKQKLRKKLRVSVSCNANCTLTTGKHAKARNTELSQDDSERLRVPLKKKARKRLAEKGKAKLRLTADDGYGDVVTRTVKVKIKR